MGIEYYDNGHTTVCRDTPENWEEFERLKAQIQRRLNPPRQHKPKKSERRKSRGPLIIYGFNTHKG